MLQLWINLADLAFILIILSKKLLNWVTGDKIVVAVEAAGDSAL